MKKILLVSGSNRNGYSEKILKMIDDKIEESKLLKLRDYNIENCRGCLYCDNKKGCTLKDDLNNIINQILDNDIIVFAIPNYFGGMSGFFKNFLDRLHYMYKTSILDNKRFVFIYTGAIEDVSITLEEMTKATKNIEKYLNLNVINRFSFSSRKEINVETINKITEFLKNID